MEKYKGLSEEQVTQKILEEKWRKEFEREQAEAEERARKSNEVTDLIEQQRKEKEQRKKANEDQRKQAEEQDKKDREQRRREKDKRRKQRDKQKK